VIRSAAAPTVGGTAVTERRVQASLSAVAGTCTICGHATTTAGRRGGCRSAFAGSSVPVGFGLAHALAHGDSTVTLGLEILEHVCSQLSGSDLVDIVADSKAITRLRATFGLVEDPLEVVLGNLDIGQLVVVICVEVEIADHIAEIFHDGLASSVAGRVRGAHVCRVFSDNITNSHLVLDHLVVSLGICNGTQILMGPCVRGHLMALGNHALDDIGPAGSSINGTLAKIVSSDEEGSLEPVRCKLVENTISEGVRTVVIGDCHSSSLLARVDTASTVRHVALLWTRIIPGTCSTWCLVCITSWAKIDKTVRGSAVVLGGTTVSSSGTAIARST